MADIYHALGLHMHQPPGNLKLLIDEESWEARQILAAYERPVKYLEQYRDVGRLHVGFSGILLEQFLDPAIVSRYAHIVNIPLMLRRYGEADNIELIGMGYYHPIFPLIPKDDWAEQLIRSRQIMQETFGREPKGFWPPEMAFCMEMIPAIKQAGYEYIVVDSVHVWPLDGGRCVPYKPYLAKYDGHEITVVPRDRDVSNAQESGLDANWFEGEVMNKAGECPPPSLVTTWSDGENGGWFRQMAEQAGFWGHFFAPYMEREREGLPIRPVLLSDYLEEHPPTEGVHVQTGAWNVGSTSGYDFSQWAGSEAQRRAIEEVFQVSKAYHELKGTFDQKSQSNWWSSDAARLLENAHRYVLQSETSCYLFWGDAWVNRVYEVTWHARELLGKAREII